MADMGRHCIELYIKNLLWHTLYKNLGPPLHTPIPTDYSTTDHTRKQGQALNLDSGDWRLETVPAGRLLAPPRRGWKRGRGGRCHRIPRHR
jgi:hypothetical protein